MNTQKKKHIKMILHILVCAALIGLASAQGESVDIKVSDDGNNRVMVTGTGNEDHGIETHEPNGPQPQFERVGYTRVCLQTKKKYNTRVVRL